VEVAIELSVSTARKEPI